MTLLSEQTYWGVEVCDRTLRANILRERSVWQNSQSKLTEGKKCATVLSELTYWWKEVCVSALRANLLRYIVTATMIRGISVCSKSKHTGGENYVLLLSEQLHWGGGLCDIALRERTDNRCYGTRGPPARSYFWPAELWPPPCEIGAGENYLLKFKKTISLMYF